MRNVLTIIPKLNEALYNFSKMFQFIVLLKTLQKLIEKVIGKWLQFHAISNKFIYSNQLGELKQHSIMNTRIFITHLIHSGWIKKLQMSMLVFDIAQFFPSLNHWLLPIILSKARLNTKILSFFSNYLIGRKTQYLWNIFTFPFFCIDIGIGQGSVLSPILSILYLSLIFHIFEKRAKNLKIPVLFLCFIDNRLFISQEKSLEKTNSHLFHSYNIIYSLLEQFRLVIEYEKSEVLFF